MLQCNKCRGITASNGRFINEIEGMTEGTDMAYFKVLSHHSMEGLRKTAKTSNR
jgi:hypothetical protein